MSHNVPKSLNMYTFLEKKINHRLDYNENMFLCAAKESILKKHKTQFIEIKLEKINVFLSAVAKIKKISQ